MLFLVVVLCCRASLKRRDGAVRGSTIGLARGAIQLILRAGFRIGVKHRSGKGNFK